MKTRPASKPRLLYRLGAWTFRAANPVVDDGQAHRRNFAALLFCMERNGDRCHG